MRSITIAAIVFGFAVSAAAQTAAPSASETQQPQPNSPRSVDVDRLPLNLNRIQRQLNHRADLEQRDGLNLRYTLQIYGAAPPLELFPPDEDLTTGPVPYGAPTHKEMLYQMTPQEFRAPAADFSALLRWLQNRNKKSSQ
jgi:hypothetical protein